MLLDSLIGLAEAVPAIYTSLLKSSLRAHAVSIVPFAAEVSAVCGRGVEGGRRERGSEGSLHRDIDMGREAPLQGAVQPFSGARGRHR